jgi:hypothetical protein
MTILMCKRRCHLFGSMSSWICGWMNYVDLDMWMLCMDVNVMFMNMLSWICGWMNYIDLDMWMLCVHVKVVSMNIVNVYVCILNCPCFKFPTV